MSTENPGFVISYVKQTSMLGEAITVNTSLPFGATEDDLAELFTRIGNALDRRMRAMNVEIKKLNADIGGKGLEEMGIDVGTVYVKEEE